MGAKIVEFLGLPGCGKTTVSGLVIDALRFDGQSVASDQDVFDIGRISSGIKLILSLINPNNYRFNVLLWRIVSRAFDKKSIKDWIYRYLKIVKLNGNINLLRNNCNYIVLSEGYYQIFSSMFDEYRLDEDIICQFSNIIEGIHIKCIHISVPVEVASERIMGREEEDDQWLKSTTELRIKKLLKRKRHIDIIVQCKDVVEVDGVNSSIILSKIIMEALRKG